MNCTIVRDRLAEHALGALPARDSAPVDRHLAWCAACRKEAGEMQRASATLAFALAPEGPPAELEDRIAEAVRGAASRRGLPESSARRSRLVLVAALAGMLAVLGTGWGAVMANRAARSDDAVLRESIRSQSAVERFRDVLNTIEFGENEGEFFLGTLSPSIPGDGGGNALTLVSPSMDDMAVVLVNGVPAEMRERLPLAVRLRGGDEVLMVGRIEKGELDDGGAGTEMAYFDDLTGYDTVIVRDANGAVVMSGTMRTRAIVASPTP